MRTRTKMVPAAAPIDPNQKLHQVLTMGMSGRIGRVFDFMGIAEEELARVGMSKTGDFRALFAGDFLDYLPELYAVHARELCGRMKAGSDHAIGTRAEVLLAHMSASLKAPLAADATAVYEQLFAELLPTEWALIGQGAPRAGIHPKQVEEDIAATARRLTGKRRAMS